MSATRRRDTACELAVRRALGSHGLRYRIDYPLPINGRRRADLAFVSRRLAVFIDGCFWHGCAEHRTHPKTNALWWKQKIDANVTRDRDTDRRMRQAGWRVLRVWEHENYEAAAERILRAYRASDPTS